MKHLLNMLNVKIKWDTITETSFKNIKYDKYELTFQPEWIGHALPDIHNQERYQYPELAKPDKLDL